MRTGRLRAGPADKKRQQGQALVYGLFVLTGGLAALFFLFNTGQLTREKTKLVTTADAVAYSAGVMHARALNFEAYANRAMMANTVAVAQLVSLSSWVQYTDSLNTYGMYLNYSVNSKYPAFSDSYDEARSAGGDLQSELVDGGKLEQLVQTVNGIVAMLQQAQQTVVRNLPDERDRLMQAVAQANYVNDGEVTVEATDRDRFARFIGTYAGDNRGPFKDAALTAARLDHFVPKRVWSLQGQRAWCTSAAPRVDWLDRRGGTELVGMDEWKALDTLSEKVWVPASMFDPLCTAIAEIPVGMGEQEAGDTGDSDTGFDPGDARWGYSPRDNPGASYMASAVSSSSWSYPGLPTYVDLAPGLRTQDDPRLVYPVRLRRATSQTATSEGRSAIASTARLNAYRAHAANDEFVAVAASEVFFQRDGTVRANVYGQGRGTPRELGSLFNPYWQVRLVQSDADIKALQQQRQQQGNVLP